jgi:hypothetical protein
VKGLLEERVFMKMIVLRFLVFALLALPFPSAFAQEGNFWEVLAEVQLKPMKDANGYTVEVPDFSKHLQSYHQKKVVIKGYLIPMQETNDGGKFMLSRLPFNVCYFCGAAGPETVVELEIETPPKFSTKQKVFEGILYLNKNDVDHHMYILKNSKEVK